MDVDVDHHINAASRTVGARTLEAGEARVVTISRTFDEPIEDVWDALTNVCNTAPANCMPSSVVAGTVVHRW